MHEEEENISFISKNCWTYNFPQIELNHFLITDVSKKQSSKLSVAIEKKKTCVYVEAVKIWQ